MKFIIIIIFMQAIHIGRRGTAFCPNAPSRHACCRTIATATDSIRTSAGKYRRPADPAGTRAADVTPLLGNAPLPSDTIFAGAEN